MAYVKVNADWKAWPNTSTPITQAALDQIEEGIANPGTVVLTGPNVDTGSFNGLGPELKIAPSSQAAVSGEATVVLAPNDDNNRFGQGRTASIRFHPERAYEADATLKAHRHYFNSTLTGAHTFPISTVTVASTTGFSSSGTVRVYATDSSYTDVDYTGKTPTTLTGCTGGTGTYANLSAVVSADVEERHVQIHTTNAAGALTDRFSIEFKANDSKILVSTAHLQFHTDSYILGQGGVTTGAVPIHGIPDVTSQSSTVSAQIQLGRTSSEARFGVAGNASDLSSSAAQADLVIRLDTATQQIILQTGNGAGAIRISATAGNAPKLGFFSTAPIGQPTGGVATAGGAYTSAEQGMLQRVYDAARALGLMT